MSSKTNFYFLIKCLNAVCRILPGGLLKSGDGCWGSQAEPYRGAPEAALCPCVGLLVGAGGQRQAMRAARCCRAGAQSAGQQSPESWASGSLFLWLFPCQRNVLEMHRGSTCFEGALPALLQEDGAGQCVGLWLQGQADGAEVLVG